MGIPMITENDVTKALQYIDENGVPVANKSKGYELVTEDGKKYPPKYVLAVADYLANGNEIDTSHFNAAEAATFFKRKGYVVEERKVKYQLTITADEVVSTDENFLLENLALGDNFKPLGAYFISGRGETIYRKYNKGERRNTNQTLPRLACQIFEKQIRDLSAWDKENFPVCQYTPERDMICGIFATPEEIKKKRNSNSIEYMVYRSENGPQFVIYSWNIFSTVYFVWECLKRFGNPGDQFVLEYREKEEREIREEEIEESIREELVQQFAGYRNTYSEKLIQSKNIIFRGAPGTGKSFLAKEIAADIISDGFLDKYDSLTDEQKKQVEFVQFHPNYDYSDFVEGLRPKMNPDGSMGFELQDGIFKKFVMKARKNYENSQKSMETIHRELSVQEAMEEFFASIEFGVDSFETVSGNKFYIDSIENNYIYISIPGNESIKKLTINGNDIRKMLESGEIFEKISDITKFFGTQYASQVYSYDFALYKEIKARMSNDAKQLTRVEELKKYIFIIDEINRGEISKILGELFFAIDPGYRGKAGSISTQYANMHEDVNEKFYIPENVYIIGTMNDIDRSVDSFDFAMRRRFRFVEIKADDRLEMLDSLNDEELKEEAIRRMTALNAEILKVEDLNANYQIGPAYFLRLKTQTFEELWTDCLQPLLKDYIQGMYEEDSIMERFAKAYGYEMSNEGILNETI